MLKLIAFSIIFSINTQAEALRLFNNQKPVVLKTENGKIKSFPSGIRAKKVGNKYLIYDITSKSYQPFSKTEETKFTAKKVLEINHNTCSDEANNLESFKQDALEAIHIIEKTQKKYCHDMYQSLKNYPNVAAPYTNCDTYIHKVAPDLNKIINEVKEKLSYLDEKALQNKYQHYKKKIHNTTDNVSEKILSFSNLIHKSYNPKNKEISFSQSTLTIPLTTKWFYSHPKLKDWIQKNWIDKGIAFPFLGNSGEGISKTTNPQDFQNIKSKLIQLRSYLLTQKLHPKKDKSCHCDEEITKNFLKSKSAHWLLTLDDTKLSQTETFIFIHDQTVKENRIWQEYIPTDQSIGCFRSNSLLSTLIHEYNVNAGDFAYFPTDTHGNPSKLPINEILRTQDKEYTKMKSIVEREHYLQIIYLKIILDL
jgi:hypothetical protein